MNAAGHSDKTQANMRMLEKGDLVVKGQRLSELFVCEGFGKGGTC